MFRSRVTVIVAVVLFFGLLFGFPTFSALLADWWWFQEVGYEVVFSRQLSTQVALFAVGALLTLSVLLLTLRITQRGQPNGPLVVRSGDTILRVELPAVLTRLGVPIALGLSLFAGLIASASWETALQWWHGVPFGLSDPVLARDIGFYVFTLPALSILLALLSALTTLSLVLAAAVYIPRGDISVGPSGVAVKRHAGVHLAVLVAVMLVLTAVRLYAVDIPELLFSNTGPLVGASYTDLHAARPAIYLSVVLALGAAALVVVGGLRERLPRYGAIAVGGYLSIALVARGVFPQLVQKFIVAPTELTRERPYLTHHIAATRQAWGLDSVDTRELNGEATLTLDDLERNAPTIDNVRLWDRDPLLQTFGQLQEIRTYYDFVSVDDDRYWIDGKYRQVLLSPRELNVASLPTRTFINDHLTFTHGMGLTLGPVNQVTVEGLPVLFIKDLPPASNVSLTVTRPQIYFGELSNDWVVTGTNQREFDQPSGEQNVYRSYGGTAGVRAGGFLKRMVFASVFASSNLLFSQDISDTSRILYNRNIVTRAKKALPMLAFDRDPYMVIRTDGTLVWMMDAYTSTKRYPYSQRLADGTTYMRNSVKVVIDAYDGSIRAYVSAPTDPIIATWRRITPDLFLPLDSMPVDLRAHMRYPDELFRAQSALYTTYHMDAPDDFYHREDQWQIPVTDQKEGAVAFMRHIVMRLPDEKGAEFIYMVPFSPRGKDNLAAWMVARNDGAEYGKLRVYQLSRQSLVFGPRQIENRINQNTEISRQVTLWDQRGSTVLRGDLLVIPIEESLLYVQPLYLQADGGRIPELKRVVVAYQNQVVMESTLDGALTTLFGSSTGARAAPTVLAAGDTATGLPVVVDASLQPLIDEARRHYQSAIEAQRDGDWARYGTEIKTLGQLLERLGNRPAAGAAERVPPVR